MKMKAIKLICLFLLGIFLIVGYALCVQKNNSLNTSTSEKENEEANIMIYVGTETDQTLTEEDFAFLEKGMSIEEIISVVGPANYTEDNIVYPYYTLDNGRLTLAFDAPLFTNTFEHLLFFTVAYSDGSGKRVDLE